MIQATLRQKDCTTEVAEFHFSIEANPSIECQENRSNKVLHTTTIHNGGWGIRIQKITLQYELDTPNVSLCKGRLAADCSLDGQALITQVPEVPQDYWKGDVKRIQVRVCVPPVLPAVDFNMSYRITAVLYSRGCPSDYELPIVVQSNMYVEVQ